MKKNTISQYFGGEAELVFWSFRYFMTRRSIHAAAFAHSLGKCVLRLPKKHKDMIKQEISTGMNNEMFGIPKIMRSEWKKVLDALGKMK
jgi:hypothetical protein